MKVRTVRGATLLVGTSISIWAGAHFAQGQPCDQFTRVASPNDGSAANFLIGVAALGADDAWAVGHVRSGSMELPLSMHWNGTTWILVAMPIPPSSGGAPRVSLYDARAFAPDDVWAVGSNPPASTGSAATETLVYHWNGSNWSIVPSPIGCCGSFGSQFYSVDGVSNDDFWAVGYKANEVAAGALAAHWNGSNWEEHLLPVSTGSVNALKDLHVIASDDIWALEAAGIFPPTTPRRIFHWDGSSWSEGAPPINGINYHAAEAIFAFGSNDIWVSSVRFSPVRTIMLHYNGSTWTETTVPVFAYEFFGSAPNDLYAVGQTSIMHWDGLTWTVMDSLAGVTQGNCFDAERAADGTLWCAGNTQPGPDSQTLTASYQFCGPTARGDANCDGGVDFFDIDPFLLALFDLPTYVTTYCDGAITGADVDGSGGVDFFDIDPFLTCLFAACP